MKKHIASFLLFAGTVLLSGMGVVHGLTPVQPIPPPPILSLTSADVTQWINKGYKLSANSSTYAECTALTDKYNHEFAGWSRSVCFQDTEGYKYFICPLTDSCNINWVSGQTVVGSEVGTGTSVTVPNKDKLDGYIAKVKAKRTEWNDDKRYGTMLDALLVKLNDLRVKYRNNNNVMEMIKYLMNGVRNLQDELAQSNGTDDFFCELSGGCGGSWSVSTATTSNALCVPETNTGLVVKSSQGSSTSIGFITNLIANLRASQKSSASIFQLLRGGGDGYSANDIAKAACNTKLPEFSDINAGMVDKIANSESSTSTQSTSTATPTNSASCSCSATYASFKASGCFASDYSQAPTTVYSSGTSSQCSQWKTSANMGCNGTVKFSNYTDNGKCTSSTDNTQTNIQATSPSQTETITISAFWVSVLNPLHIITSSTGAISLPIWGGTVGFSPSISGFDTSGFYSDSYCTFTGGWQGVPDIPLKDMPIVFPPLPVITGASQSNWTVEQVSRNMTNFLSRQIDSTTTFTVKCGNKYNPAGFVSKSVTVNVEEEPVEDKKTRTDRTTLQSRADVAQAHANESDYAKQVAYNAKIDLETFNKTHPLTKYEQALALQKKEQDAKAAETARINSSEYQINRCYEARSWNRSLYNQQHPNAAVTYDMLNPDTCGR